MESVVDGYNLRRVILESFRQFQEGFQVVQSLGELKENSELDTVVISGMGGSALPGDIFQVYLQDLWVRGGKTGKQIQVIQNRFYTLPPESYGRCLNIICSHSGNTEETIASFEEALAHGLSCVGVSSGGKIEEMCQKHGVPHVKLPIPFENFQPRTATGHFFSATLCVMMRVFGLPDESHEILKEALALQSSIEKLESEGKNIASWLKGKTPIIYASAQFRSLAMIWKIKINENSKTPAFWNYFPELNHNEMVGYTFPQAKFATIMLRDPDDHPRNSKRYEITAELLKKQGVDVRILDITHGSVFNKIFHTLYLGDWVSYYLALEYGIDPTPVDMVEDLKKML